MLTRYYDEYEMGDRYVSRGRTITEADIVNFAGLTGDWYPLHVDVEYAKRTEFGQRIAHGMLVLSVASGLVPISPDVLVAFYGMDELRFTAPTFIGDTLHVETEVIEKRDRGPGGVLSSRQQVVKQTGEVAASCIMRVLLRSRANAIAGNSAPE
jgi:3-hydroxybutyryl-CoA dehydratase